MEKVLEDSGERLDLLGRGWDGGLFVNRGRDTP